MKRFIFLFALIAVCTAIIDFPSILLKNKNDKFKSNIDPFFDIALNKFNYWLQTHDKDPYVTSDIHKEFKKKVGPVTWHGKLDFTHGLTKGLSTLKRNDIALLSHEQGVFNVTVPITFDNLHVLFDYAAEFMKLKRNGQIFAHIRDFELSVNVTIDTIKSNLLLQQFQITKLGHMKIKFTGNKGTDWLFNFIADVITELFHNSVQHLFEKDIKEEINKKFDEINHWDKKNSIPMFY